MCSEMESTLAELPHQTEDKADLLTKVKALIQQLSTHPMMGVKDISQLFSTHDWQFLLSLDENIIADATSSLVQEKDQMIQERKRMIQELRASKIEKEENGKNGPPNPS